MIARLFFAAILALGLAAPARAEIDIQEVTSPGGIDAWLVEDRSIPFVAVELWFLGGAALDEPGKRGATNLMTGLLNEGAGDLGAFEFAEAVEGLAASFGFDAGNDAVVISAQMLTQNRDAAAALLRDALVTPQFADAAIGRVRRQVLATIESDLQDPNAIAGQTFSRLAYDDHPYGTPIEGSIESVTALTREDLVTAHRNVIARDRVVVGAVGDISAGELGALLDTILGDLPAEGAPMPGPATYALDGGLTVVDYDSPQSVALFGHEGIERDDPEFFPAFVLNQILGGSGFQSRLMTEVRVERGLTYGIGSFLSLADHGPRLVGQLASSNELVGEAIEVIRAEWADLAENGVTQEELDAAIRYMTGEYPLRFDGNARIAGILAAMQSDGMPIDYIATRNDRVAAVTLEDVRAVAERLLRPDNLHFVVVGQPEGLNASN